MPYAKYFQIATVKPNGRPANRTVVFRGFLGKNHTRVTPREEWGVEGSLTTHHELP